MLEFDPAKPFTSTRLRRRYTTFFESGAVKWLPFEGEMMEEKQLSIFKATKVARGEPTRVFGNPAYVESTLDPREFATVPIIYNNLSSTFLPFPRATLGRKEPIFLGMLGDSFHARYSSTLAERYIISSGVEEKPYQVDMILRGLFQLNPLRQSAQPFEFNEMTWLPEGAAPVEPYGSNSTISAAYEELTGRAGLLAPPEFIQFGFDSGCFYHDWEQLSETRFRCRRCGVNRIEESTKDKFEPISTERPKRKILIDKFKKGEKE